MTEQDMLEKLSNRIVDVMDKKFIKKILFC